MQSFGILFSGFLVLVSSLAVTSLERINTDVAVVGAGITGSTIAFYLNQNGVDVFLAEAADDVGGNMKSKNGNENRRICFQFHF
jgi:ribulose 1,5-bisphosphate synthetase/thiazole synthase